MDISIFNVIEPIMIGPSSSHTANVVKLASVARLIVLREFTHVSFGLHGSFDETCREHDTDSAAPIKDDNSNTYGVVMAFLDVSEEKEIKNKINEGRNK